MSMSRPIVNGMSVSLVKYLMVCGLPSSTSVKSSLDRFPTSPPALFRTETRTLTTSTSTLMEGVTSSGSAGFWDCARWVGTSTVASRPTRISRAYALEGYIELHYHPFRRSLSELCFNKPDVGCWILVAGCASPSVFDQHPTSNIRHPPFMAWLHSTLFWPGL